MTLISEVDPNNPMHLPIAIPATDLPIHPAAQFFPMMRAMEFELLKSDIREFGQRDDIILWCGQILDGRNRWQACIELDIIPRMSELPNDEDPYEYVVSKNLHRRNLPDRLRGLIAAKLIKAIYDRKENPPIGGREQKMDVATAAKLMNVSKRSVERAKSVLEKGSDEVVRAVEDGELAIGQAAELVAAVPEKEFQTELLKEGAVEVRRAIKQDVRTASQDREEDMAKTAVNEFKKLWNKCDRTGRHAIRVWIDENYLVD